MEELKNLDSIVFSINESPKWSGYMFPNNYWNGWATPLVEEKELIKIAKYWNEHVYSDDYPSKFYQDESNGNWFFCQGEPGMEDWELDVFRYKNKILYDISLGLVWWDEKFS